MNPKVITISGKARNGKDSFATMLKQELESVGQSVVIMHYADRLKYIAKQYFNWDGKKDVAGRNLLQQLGTDIVRSRDVDFWVRSVAEVIALFHDVWDYVIISDCRFPSEVDYMKCNYDTYSIHIARTDYESELSPEQQNHPSETALDNFEFDYYVRCKSGLEHIHSEVYQFLRWLNESC